MMIPTAFRLRSMQWSAAIYGVVTLICTQLPLVDYLGYEFAFVLSFVVTAVAGWTTIQAVGAAYHIPEIGVGAATKVFREMVWANIVLLLIPAVLMTANAAIVKNCSFLLGLGFFVAIPVVTALFSCSLAMFCVVHYRYPKAAYTAFFLATIIYALALGYWTPAIFSYNFFYGYFPGITYDEILELRWPLVLFRLVTLFVGVLFVSMARMLLSDARPGDTVRSKGLKLVRAMISGGMRARTAIAVGIIGCLYVFRCELGFESTTAFVQRTLGAVVETEHMTIYYDSTSIGKTEIARIAVEHEFRLAQTWNAFLLPHRGHIASYIYPSVQEKQRLIGAGVTSIAKPWRREVHCSKQSLEMVLKHELTHVVAGVFGVPIFRASLSPGLTEGLASALEVGWGTRTLQQYAAALQRAGLVPDMRRMMTPRGFAEQSSSISYVLAGSFCRYLIDRFGIRKLTQVYGGSEYGVVYGRPLDELLRDWERYLVRVPEFAGDEDVVDAFFRRPPIFGKVCARVIAERNNQAHRVFEGKDYRGAATLFSVSYAEAGSYEALSGWFTSALRAGEYEELIGAYDSIIARSKRPSEYLSLYLPLGDAFWAHGDPMFALNFYDRLARAELTPAHTEGAILRALAIDDDRCSTGLMRVFLSSDSDTLRAAILDSLWLAAPNDLLVQYLRGKFQLRLGRFGESLATLQRITLQNIDGRLESARCLAIADVLFRLNRFQEAKAAYWTSLNVHYSDAAKAYVDDCVERCDWMTEHGAP